MRFTLRRLLTTVFVLWGVCTITFFLLHLTPGDPTELLMRESGSGNEAAQLRHQLGLDQPLAAQYFSFLKNLVHGDLGMSYSSRLPVMTELLRHLPSTLYLALTSMLFALVIGIPAGVFAAVNNNSWHHRLINRVVDGYTLLGLSMPSFWLGPLLIIFFSIKLDLFPVNGQETWSSVVLPAVSLGFGLSAVIARMTRASFLEVLNEDYIRVARAKGLSDTAIFYKHALKNALTPIVTIVSLQFGAVLTGVVITETIFDWPGVGILLFTALKSRNYPLVQGCILVIAALYVIVNFFTDVVYIFINPKLRMAAEA